MLTFQIDYFLIFQIFLGFLLLFRKFKPLENYTNFLQQFFRFGGTPAFPRTPTEMVTVLNFDYLVHKISIALTPSKCDQNGEIFLSLQIENMHEITLDKLEPFLVKQHYINNYLYHIVFEFGNALTKTEENWNSMDARKALIFCKYLN